MLCCLWLNQNLIVIIWSLWAPEEEGCNLIVNLTHPHTACSGEMVPDTAMASSAALLCDWVEINSREIFQFGACGICSRFISIVKQWLVWMEFGGHDKWRFQKPLYTSLEDEDGRVCVVLSLCDVLVWGPALKLQALLWEGGQHWKTSSQKLKRGTWVWLLNFVLAQIYWYSTLLLYIIHTQTSGTSGVQCFAPGQMKQKLFKGPGGPTSKQTPRWVNNLLLTNDVLMQPCFLVNY